MMIAEPILTYDVPRPRRGPQPTTDPVERWDIIRAGIAAGDTLAEIGQRLGGLSRQRIQQLFVHLGLRGRNALARRRRRDQERVTAAIATVPDWYHRAVSELARRTKGEAVITVGSRGGITATLDGVRVRVYQGFAFRPASAVYAHYWRATVADPSATVLMLCPDKRRARRCVPPRASGGATESMLPVLRWNPVASRALRRHRF